MEFKQNNGKDKKSSDMLYNVKYHEELKKDENYILVALRSKPELFVHIDNSFRNDKTFVMKAIKESFWVFKYATEYQNDKDVALVAVSNNALALKFAGPDVKKDFDIVKLAVSNNYHTLEFADNTLKKDDNIVLTAINNCGLALMYADDEEKDKEYIVKKAVLNNAYAIKYASPRLQNEPQFLLDLIFLNPNVLAYAECNINEMIKLIKDNEKLERLEKLLLNFEENRFNTRKK